jgi:hypothetical protein
MHGNMNVNFHPRPKYTKKKNFRTDAGIPVSERCKQGGE